MANPVGYRSTQNIRDASQNQRDRVVGQGDELLQLEKDRAAEAERRRNYYGDYNDELFRGDAEGNGGFNQDETRRIYGDEGLGGLQQTADEANRTYLTGQEAADIRGNVGSQERFFDPDRMGYELAGQQGRQSQAVDDYDQRLRQTINPDNLKQSQTYRDNSRNILQQNRGGFDATFQDAAKNVRGAIDPGAVTTSQGFLDDYNMSPEEKQNTITGAGISAGMPYRAAVGETMRRAQAAGSSPLGVAAYRARMAQSAGAAAGDAMTQARIKADEADAARKLTGEQLRMQGGRYLTDVRTGTEADLGHQAIAGQQQLGQQALGQENAMEQNRQGAEQFLTEADQRAAQAAGTARIQNTQNETATGQQQRQYAATTGTGIAQAQDRDASARAAQVATNRQGAEQYNQDQRYGRGMAVNNQQSQRATTVGNTRLNQQNTARNYYTGQANQANENAQNAYGRQQQTYGTQTSGGNTATGNQVHADQVQSQKPSTFDKIVGGFTGIAKAASMFGDGGIVDSPTVAVLGESGPEAVVPLSYRANAKVRPGMIPQPPQKRQYYGQAA